MAPNETKITIFQWEPPRIFHIKHPLRNNLQFIRVEHLKSHTGGTFGGKIGRCDIHESRLNLVTGRKKTPHLKIFGRKFKEQSSLK